MDFLRSCHKKPQVSTINISLDSERGVGQVFVNPNLGFLLPAGHWT